MRGSNIFSANAASTVPHLAHARSALSAVLLCFLCFSLHSQTLARPGWAGSGLSAETWWRNAVFYRVAPLTFQDSDGDGKGDLRGIAQRMSYLQSLGVDAIVLQAPFDETGFDDLLSEASRRHIRLLIALTSSNSANAIAAGRLWLTRGCAGIWLRVPAKSDAVQTAELIGSLRKLTDSFPGQRVLVEDTSGDPAVVPAPGAQLVVRPLIDGVGERTDALSLRVQLAQLSTVPRGSAPLILLVKHGAAQSTEETNHHEALRKMLAAAMFLSRAAVLVEAGEEIDSSTTDAPDNVMRWTPSNLTPAPATESAATPQPPPPRREDEYGPYVPYVAATKPNAVDQTTDLDALPGFSSTPVGKASAEKHETVASEDNEANSLLNFYRRLSQLHHEAAALRSGATSLLNLDADNVLAWLRKVPSGARTSASVIIACNFGDTAKTIAFTTTLPKQNAYGNSLRPLLSSSPVNAQVVQRLSAVVVAPWSVVVLSSSR